MAVRQGVISAVLLAFILAHGSASVDKSCPESRSPQCPANTGFRTIDGSCHQTNSVLGMSGTPYKRILNPAYQDGFHLPRRTSVDHKSSLPLPRDIVNKLLINNDVPNPEVNHFFMNWAQLVAHDVTLIDAGFPSANSQCCTQAARGPTDQCARIDIPNDDQVLRPSGVSCLGMQRAGSQACGRRSYSEQRNMVTHYIDASFVYGSDVETANQLRSMQGGLLRSRDMNNEEHLPEDNQGNLFAGDGRVGVTAMLASVQTVLLREHNRLARALAQINPHWDDERLYQEARKIVIAEWQLITYRDWLPWLIGREHVEKEGLRLVEDGYSKHYDPRVDPSTANDFAAAAYRSLHSLIQNDIWFGKTGERTQPVADATGNIVLQPNVLHEVVEGMLYQPSQEQDRYIVDQIKNRMFAPNPQALGGDLVSTDIQRGRDHGLPSYNHYRRKCGYGLIERWEEFPTDDQEAIRVAESLYKTPEDLDFYVGGLLERREGSPAAITSPVFRCIVADQFSRYMKGDRYFFDMKGPGQFTHAQLAEIRKLSASKLMCENIPGLQQVPRDAFANQGAQGNSEVQCSELPGLDLNHWKENTWKKLCSRWFPWWY